MKIQNNKIDWVMEGMCIALLVGIVLCLLICWGNIPERIPGHYDAMGNIDRWGKKGEILFLPILSCVLYLLITGLEQIPRIWNVGVKVTEENQYRVYRCLKYMIKSVKLLMVADFSYLTLHTLTGKPLPWWFTFVFLGLMFGDLIFWIVRLYRVQ